WQTIQRDTRTHPPNRSQSLAQIASPDSPQQIGRLSRNHLLTKPAALCDAADFFSQQLLASPSWRASIHLSWSAGLHMGKSPQNSGCSIFLSDIAAPLCIAFIMNVSLVCFIVLITFTYTLVREK